MQYFDKVGSGNVVREVEKDFNHSVGKGWHYQADEVARCVRDGKRESEIWTHEKSLMEMQIFDEVSSNFLASGFLCCLLETNEYIFN